MSRVSVFHQTGTKCGRRSHVGPNGSDLSETPAPLLSTRLMSEACPPQNEQRQNGTSPVKHVRNSFCNLACTKVFTLSPLNLLRKRNIGRRNFESSGGQTTKTGGSDPTFSAFSRPKGSWGRSHPFLRHSKPGAKSTAVQILLHGVLGRM